MKTLYLLEVGDRFWLVKSSKREWGSSWIVTGAVASTCNRIQYIVATSFAGVATEMITQVHHVYNTGLIEVVELDDSSDVDFIGGS